MELAQRQNVPRKCIYAHRTPIPLRQDYVLLVEIQKNSIGGGVSRLSAKWKLLRRH